MPVICEDEKLPAVLPHIPSAGRSHIMTLLTTAAPLRISLVAHLAFFVHCLMTCVLTSKGWSYKAVLSEIVDDTLQPFPSRRRAFIQFDTYCICVLDNCRVKRLCWSLRTPYISISPALAPRHGPASRHILLIFRLAICTKTLKSHTLCNFLTLS